MKSMSLLTFAVSVALFISSAYANAFVFAYIAIISMVLSGLVFFMSIREKSSN